VSKKIKTQLIDSHLRLALHLAEKQIGDEICGSVVHGKNGCIRPCPAYEKLVCERINIIMEKKLGETP